MVCLAHAVQPSPPARLRIRVQVVVVANRACNGAIFDKYANRLQKNVILFIRPTQHAAAIVDLHEVLPQNGQREARVRGQSEVPEGQRRPQIERLRRVN